MKVLRAYKGARSGNLLVLADRIVSIIDREDTLTKTVVLACLTSDVLGIPIIDERMPETIIELKRSSLFPPSEEAVPPNIVIY
jgi:hypothetical protein